MSATIRRRNKKDAPSESAASDNAPSSAAKAKRLVAIIVGGGPAGALAAKSLSDRNYDVDLYESCPRPTGSDEPSKAYVISLNPRGQRALRRVGIDVDVDLDGALRCDTVVSHPSSSPPPHPSSAGASGGGGGTTTTTKLNPSRAGPTNDVAVIAHPPPGNVIVKRRNLASSLLSKAEKAGATVHFGWNLVSVNFDGRVATFRNVETEKETEVEYDLLLGADGSKSAVRSLLAKRSVTFRILKAEEDDMEYQVGTLPSPVRDLLVEDASVRESIRESSKDGPAAATHSYVDAEVNGTASTFPLEGDRTLVCVIYPHGMLQTMKCNSTPKDPKGYEPHLRALLSDWTDDARLALAKRLAEEDNVPSNGGTCVWTSSLSDPNLGVALVGDSGHGMWPSLGQGCNAALESVAVLTDAVEAIDGASPTGARMSYGAGVRGEDLSSATGKRRADALCAEYDGLRRDDATAAVDLTYGGMGGRRARGGQHSPVLFKAQTALFVVLNKITLGIVPMPAMVRLMRGEDVGYAALKNALVSERWTLYATFAAFVYGLATFAVWMTRVS